MPAVTERVYNFSPGPATLPLSVLQEVQRDLISLRGVGASALEVSHRSPWFEGVIDEAEANIRGLLVLPDDFAVVFCQGGATQQFSMVPMNLLRRAEVAADHIVTGSWGAKAVVEAAKEGEARVAWTGQSEGYVRVPSAAELESSLNPDAPYVHITSNETIVGVEWPDGSPSPTSHGVPMVCDASSDFLSRPVDIRGYGLVYAGAQKNAGAAGATVVILRRDLLERIPDGLPAMLDYRTFVEHGSLYNTPPVFSIYVLLLVTRWLRDEVGGLSAQAALNRRKADALYGAIDASGGFYRGHADPGSRSRMNVTWRLPGEALERRFVEAAAAEGMVELKGHRSVGGIRASLYNAMPLDGALALAGFMQTFAATNG